MYSSIDDLECVKYQDNFIQTDFNVYKRILSEVTFNSDEESSIYMYGKKINIPRKQVAFGEAGTFYRFSGVKVTPRPFEESKTISVVLDVLKKKLGIDFNFVLVNYYQDGSKHIGYHSDDEADLSPNYPIASLSFGQERPFRLRHKVTGKTHEIILKNNSCICMYPPCQKIYKHSVPKTAKKIEGRINLTFRRIQITYSK